MAKLPSDFDVNLEQDFETRGQKFAADKKWIEAQPEKKCHRCGETKWLTVDHVVPIIFLRDLRVDPGLHYDPHNYRIMCGPCNQFKGGHIDPAEPRAKALLLKYTSRLPDLPTDTPS